MGQAMDQDLGMEAGLEMEVVAAKVEVEVAMVLTKVQNMEVSLAMVQGMEAVEMKIKNHKLIKDEFSI